MNTIPLASSGLRSLAVAFLALVLVTNAPAAVTNVAYWRFGENDPGATNGVTTTSTTNLLGGSLAIFTNALYTNAVSATAATRVGSTLGLRFSSGNFGTNALVSTLTNNFGLELWVRPDTNNVTQCLAYNGNSAGNGWGLYILGGQYVGLYGGVGAVGAGTAVPGVWTHLALVRNNGTNTLYTNGVAAGSSVANPNLPTGSFAVAVRPQSLANEFFAGALDEVRVFSFAPGGFSTNDLLFNNGLIVNTTNNSGPGSLRDVIAAAPAGSTITFATNLAGQTITLTSGELVISNSLTITASNLAANVIISGGGTSRIFYLNNNANVTMSGLTLTGGNGVGAANSNLGGAICQFNGSLTMTRCTLSGNSASGPGSGGAIYSSATVILNLCTLSGNSAVGNGGAIASSGSLTLNQCTLSGNSATLNAGAVDSFASLTVVQSTIIENSASGIGGGIYKSGGSLRATNSIIAGNTAASSTNVFGPFNSSVSNLVNVLPLLAPLGNYGGPTQTRPPLLGSPAIDAGDNSVTNSLTTDQRGLPRLVGARVDIGAVEGGVAAIVVNTTAATAVGTTNATLNGTVNPVNFSTAAWFEWGTTTNYGNVTATNTLAATNATLAVSHPLSGLTPGLTYHYRLAASNALGVSYGTNVSFVTSPFQTVSVFNPSLIGSGTCMEWGDFNNDGWLDLLAPTFYENTEIAVPQPTVWRNTGGSFTNTGQTFPVLTSDKLTTALWQDFDLDGRLDFFYDPLGANYLFRNTGTNFANVTATTLPPLGLGVGVGVAWGDYDNDGRPDLLYSGGTTFLLHNTPGGFVPVSIPGISGFVTGAPAWADFDNDGWLDFAISGRQATNIFLGVNQLWRNTGTGFTNVTASLAPGLPQTWGFSEIGAVAVPALAWGDYDNDGRLDLLVTGTTNRFDSGRIAQIWRNTPTGFVQVPIPGLPGSFGSPHWADYDNDGRLDFYVSGVPLSGDKSQVWRNTGSGFELTWSIPDSSGVGSVADWGDFNNDGKLDLVIPMINQLLQNVTAVSNTPPSAPTGLTATLTNNTVVFAWNAATDAQTPSSGLSYNVRVGTTPGGNDLVTGQVNVTNGVRRVPALGNAQMNRFFRFQLSQAPVGPIYWSVQAVDTAFAGGAFAAESVFTNGFSLASVPGLPGGSRAAWGDYDNDGRLDVFVTGGDGVSQLWRNTGSTFTNVPIAGLPALQASAVAWGDYDNDSRLDFVLLGSPDGSEENAVSQLWRNTGSGFSNVSATQLPGLPGFLSGAAAWGDCDNDGRLDLVVGGSYFDGVNYLSAAQLWRNTGTNFTNVTASRAPGLAGGPESAFAWADYDGDGRLDLLAAGNGAAQLWRNTGSNFVNVTASAAPGLPGVFGAAMAWGDYDNDGRPDFILTGATNNSPLIPVTQLWRNTGSGFTNVPGTGLAHLYAGGVQWGDYDADGRLDVLLNGVTTSLGFIFTNQLWRNTSTGFVAVGFSGLPQIGSGHSAWADFDNDGKLDFLTLGNAGGFVSQLWRNLSFASNTPPTAPTGLAMTRTANAAMLSWSAATDAQTPSSGLTYNVRAGTTPGGTNLLATHVNTTNGFRRVPARGNAEQRQFLPLLGVTNSQTIYWSVQAVDAGFAGGPFASEVSEVTIPQINILPNTATNALLLWTPPTFGWVLQTSPDLAPAAWSNAPSGALNPVLIPLTNAPKTFYRLVVP